MFNERNDKISNTEHQPIPIISAIEKTSIGSSKQLHHNVYFTIFLDKDTGCIS